MGDPSLDFVTKIPDKLEIEVIDQVYAKAQELEIKALVDNEPLGNVQVGFYKDNALLATGFTDENGSARVPIMLSSDGNLEIRAIAHNKIPAYKVVEVIPESLRAFLDLFFGLFN